MIYLQMNQSKIYDQVLTKQLNVKITLIGKKEGISNKTMVFNDYFVNIGPSFCINHDTDFLTNADHIREPLQKIIHKFKIIPAFKHKIKTSHKAKSFLFSLVSQDYVRSFNPKFGFIKSKP